ncbi:MAG: CHAD domain-containing protein [Planctomycetes bacterium]|nr:CHAD domain-containing protein [Planctomycetota bacterium]
MPPDRDRIMVGTELGSPTRSRWRRFQGGARRILEQGLRSIVQLLADIDHGRTDPDRIHDLRVAARRSLAHLSLLRDVLPGRPRRWFRRRLRLLHRVAARVRDLDIVAARIGGYRSVAGSRCGRRLLAKLVASRRAAERRLRRLAVLTGASGWEERVGRLCAPLRHTDVQRCWQHRVRGRLERVIDRFRRAGRRRCRGEAEIHGLRIAGKKLRYHLDAFATLLPNQAVNASRDSLHELQDRLGACTDRAASARTMRQLQRAASARRERRGWRRCRHAEQAAARRARRAFTAWWDRDRRRTFRRHCRELLGNTLP